MEQQRCHPLIPGKMKVLSTTPIEFAVAAVSQNTNSFGLRQHVLVAQSGEAWTLCLNYLETKSQGDRLFGVARLLEDGRVKVHFNQGEIPERLPDAPAALVNSIWRFVAAA